MKSYQNPVRRGFYPDPSVIRVGNDFYMVNSSFQYFPCIPISHSTDMVNWETVGFGISNPEYLDLSLMKDSHGIWAPDIFYDENENLFYIIATLRQNDRENKYGAERVQLLMKSKRPEGPYSKPTVLEINAIDPSLFFDDDGRKYVIIAPGARAFELSGDCTGLTGVSKTLWSGTGERCSEGPHIMKHNGYYYAIVAEGGTGYGHGINVARSTELFGDYEPCPYNPVMRQTDPEKSIQRAGHGKLVEDQNGDWWAFYLCGRRNEGNYTTLGRESALDPVTWTDDGWFLINNGNGPSEVNTAPNLPTQLQTEKDFYDDFSNGFECDMLGLEWEFVRNPDYENISFENPGLRLYTTLGNLNTIPAKNILVHREIEFCYTADTKIKFEPQEDTRAGVTCYYSTATYIRFDITRRGGKKLIELVINRNVGEKLIAESEISQSELCLKVITEKQTRRFLYSTDGREYTELGEVYPCTFLCDEGVPTDRKRHTGTLVGIFANTDDEGIRLPADFSYFQIKYEN